MLLRLGRRWPRSWPRLPATKKRDVSLARRDVRGSADQLRDLLRVAERRLLAARRTGDRKAPRVHRQRGLGLRSISRAKRAACAKRPKRSAPPRAARRSIASPRRARMLRTKRPNSRAATRSRRRSIIEDAQNTARAELETARAGEGEVVRGLAEVMLDRSDSRGGAMNDLQFYIKIAIWSQIVSSIVFLGVLVWMWSQLDSARRYGGAGAQQRDRSPKPNVIATKPRRRSKRCARRSRARGTTPS